MNDETEEKTNYYRCGDENGKKSMKKPCITCHLKYDEWTADEQNTNEIKKKCPNVVTVCSASEPPPLCETTPVFWKSQDRFRGKGAITI
jgi:hypothetical protein